MSSVYHSLENMRNHNQTFAERVDMNECFCAIGRIFISFSWLESSLDREIENLVSHPKPIVPVFTSEMSFKNKISALSSMVRMAPPLRSYNTGSEAVEEVWNDIVKMLFQCEELRNKIAHGEWSERLIVPYKDELLTRTKKTAKAHRGLQTVIEKYDSGHLLDIADYILCVECDLREFFY